MIKIDRTYNEFNADGLFPYTFSFTNENLEKIFFHQIGSGDLCFTGVSKNKEISLVIDESDFLLYKVIEDLYLNLTTGKFLLTDLKLWDLQIEELLTDKEIKKELPFSKKIDLNNLYNGDYVSYKSDAPFNECENDTELKYNYLNIYKVDNKYELRFINNSLESRFTIEFNTDRSRYGAFVYAFSILLKRLEIITEEKSKVYVKKEN